MTGEVLVVQGPVLDAARIDALVRMTDAVSVAHVGAHAVRLSQPRSRAGIAEFCDANGLDHAFVPATARLADFRLAVMDMDSTLITIECVDELADMVGVKPEVAAITAAAMRGEIEYAESLRRRVALLEGLTDSALQRVYDERLGLSPGAEPLLARLKALGIRTLLVSGGFTFFTDRLRTRLGLDDARSNLLEIRDGRLTGKLIGRILDGQGKAAALREARDALGLERSQVLAIGDGANDLPMMAAAGVSIAYRAKPVVRQQATYSLNHAGLDGVLALFA